MMECAMGHIYKIKGFGKAASITHNQQSVNCYEAGVHKA